MDTPLRNILKTQISNLLGFEFQSFINNLFLSYYGSLNYTPTRKVRDQGCDGIINNHTIIACYGYNKLKKGKSKEKSDILNKLKSDFDNYIKNWSNKYPFWSFIINQEMPAYLPAEIIKLKPDSQPIGLDQLVGIIVDELLPPSKKAIYEYLKVPKYYYIALGDEFWSFVEIVDPETYKSIRKNKDSKRKFHSIVPLSWDYIASHADTERDIYNDIIKIMTINTTNDIKFICIKGQPLSGKSTLMRRLGFDLASNSRTVLHVYKGNNHPDIWNNLTRFYEFINREILILVDDIFENDSAFRTMMRFLTEEACNVFKITIIGTAVSNDRLNRRLNDIEKIGIPMFHKELLLTENEKNRILINLEIDPLTINSRAYERLIAVNLFYSYLMHAYLISQSESVSKAGIPSTTIEEWRLKDLEKHQPRLYEAYKYVCYAHQYKLSIPTSLIQRMENSKFSDILELRGRHDWIFDTTSKYSKISSLESAHWFLAQIYWDVYVQFKSPQFLINEMLSTASPDNYPESLFILHLFRVIQENRSAINLRSILLEHSNKIRNLQIKLGVDSLCIWSRIYKAVQMEEQESNCLNEAKKRPPVNVADLRVLIPLIENEDPKRALSLFQHWLEKEPNNGTLRVAYLEFLSRKANIFPDEIQKVIDQYNEWIENAGDFWDSTQAFIKFLINHSPDIKKPLKLNEITFSLSDWLTKNENHSNASKIWDPYIKLMKYHDSETMIKTLDDCWRWLQYHNEEKGFISLMPLFISELKKWAPAKFKEDVLEYLLNWITLHPEVYQIKSTCLILIDGEWPKTEKKDTVVRYVAADLHNIDHAITVCKVISLIRKYGTKEHISKNIDELYEWLQSESHNQEHIVRASYLRLVSDFGRAEQVSCAITNTLNWLSINENQTVLAAYIALIEKRDKNTLKYDLIEKLNTRFEESRHSNENTVRTKYLILVIKHGNSDQVERAIIQTYRWWVHCFDQTVITAFVGLIEYRKKNQLISVINRAKKYLSEYPNKSQTLRKKIDSIEKNQII